MSLRIQLLGLVLLTLVLPWAGYRYVQELEGALRSGLEQSLLAGAGATAAALDEPDLRTVTAATGAEAERVMYAHPLAAEPLLDGYRDDWTSAAATGTPLGAGGRFWVGLHERSLYLFLRFTDASLVYQRAPGESPYGDRVLLLVESLQPKWLMLHTTAPGGLRGQETEPPLFAPSGRQDPRVPGFWRETADGFAAEVRLPIDLAGGRLGITVVDVDLADVDLADADPADVAPIDADPADADPVGVSPVNADAAGTDPPAAAYRVAVESSWSGAEPDVLFYRPARLGMAVAQFVQPGRRLRIVDTAGWVLFDDGAIDPLAASFDDRAVSLAERFFRLVLKRDDPPYLGLEQPLGRLRDGALSAVLAGEAASAWFARGGEASAVVAAAAPIARNGTILGAVVVEQGSDSILTLTNAALVRLMSVTFLATLVVATGLLGYATVLSFRVRRLSRAAETALGPRGEISAALPGRGARDEIGDLARSFSDLLHRLRDYTAYLTTLKAKLAHELRTPLAVVATSLENLEREPHGSNLSPYLARLKEGVTRLDGILNAMAEATLIEQAIADTDPEVFDLHGVLESCTAAYGDVYPRHTFGYENRASRTLVLGSAELIVQMMDKLIDNAVSFSPADAPVRITLTGARREVVIGVANHGPPLPESMRAQLFDSLVSVRPERGGRRHLGLGLHIVSLVAEFHSGTVRGDDLPDGSGVIFEIALPVAGNGKR